MSDSSPQKFPPGPPPNLIRSLFGAMQQNPLDYFTAMAQEYGDVSGMRIGKFRSLFINHPDLIEDVLVNNSRKYHKGRILQANKYLFGEGLLTSEGDFWLRQRRLAQPAFHRARVSAYAATMAEYTEQLIATWRNGEERDIHEEMMQLALRIVGKTLFDADVTRDAKEVGETLDILLHIAANFGRTILVPLWVPTPRNIRAKLGIKRLEKVIYRIIADRRASGRDTGDLLSILLQAQDEDGTHMNDRQLRDETITLFLAGHETTANTLSWTWWLLAQNPAVEKKFHEELDGVLGGRAPTVDDLPKLTYLSHVLTESLRLYPTAWGMARLAAEEHEIAGYPRNRRLSGASRIWRGVCAVGDTPRRALVRRRAGVSPAALGERLGQAAPAIRVFSLWRRPASVHRQHLCPDGSQRGAGNRRAEVPLRPGAGSQGHPVGFHYLAAQKWHSSEV